MDQFHRDNHFVPRIYLKQWETPDRKVWAYRILVPHGNVPIWKAFSKTSVGWHAHLYTQVVAGHETDDVERWFDMSSRVPLKNHFTKQLRISV